MPLNLLLLCTTFVIGVVLEVTTSTQAVPIQAIYTDDSCDCPKKLNYLVNKPETHTSENYKPSEYGYNLEWPLPAKAKVTYSFDFMVEEPKTLPPPSPEMGKLELYAKVDRIMAHKKDCLAKEAVPRPCGCQQCVMTNSYVSPENNGERYRRNVKPMNNIDDNIKISMAPTHIMAIFLEPLKHNKSRNKRDLSRIFIRPRKNVKRSDRMVKQYNKRLKDVPKEREHFDDTQISVTPRTKTAVVRPLQQLSSLLNLPNLRNKRDIKGEYDLIEKEREQMDLTLPEIIQYLPETLNPNFQRNQCHDHDHYDVTKTITTTKPSSVLVANEGQKTNKNDSKTIVSNNIKENNEGNVKVPDNVNVNMSNSISLMHKKRNTRYYKGGCPTVSKHDSPTPNPIFTYEPLPNFETMPRPFNTIDNLIGPDPVPQQYVDAPQNPYYSPPNSNSHQSISNTQLDQIIAEIVRKHSDFIQANSHQDGALVDPPKVQEQQAKHFLKSLMVTPWNNWFGDYHQN